MQEKANSVTEWKSTDGELPMSLDEVYMRVLKDIKKPDQDHARRVLHCLAVAIRPLHVEELAEVCSTDVDDAKEYSILLARRTGLVTTIQTRNSRTVELSQSSVREFLTSTRLATSSGDVAYFHINLKQSHTTLAQACLDVLLQPEIEEGAAIRKSPLLGYAAEHWVTHAQSGGVSPCLQKAMEYLFDSDKPHFAAWLRIHDIDTEPRPDSPFEHFSLDYKPTTTPLYYAALCGFQDLVQHLLDRYPHHLNAHGGWFVTPLVAALAQGHLRTVEFLR